MLNAILAALAVAPVIAQAATNIGNLATLEVQGGSFLTTVQETDGVYFVESIFETDQAFTGTISFNYTLLAGQPLRFTYLAAALVPYELPAGRSLDASFATIGEAKHYDGTTDGRASSSINGITFPRNAYDGFTPVVDTPVEIDISVAFNPGTFGGVIYGPACGGEYSCFGDKHDTLRVVFRSYISTSAVPEPQVYGLALAGAVIALAAARRTGRRIA